jgi:glyoxylate reductase
VLSEDTADVAMALILSVPRRLVEGDGRARSGNWTGWSPTGMLGHRINGKRLGIIGMGQIGQAIARRARGFGMSVHYHNRNAVHPAIEAELEATYWDDLDEMLRRMDIVSVNCPFTDATKGLVSAERLALMPEHAYLVNTARGEIVDEIALAQALEAGAIVVMLPHIGSATIEGRHAMGDKVIINIQTFLDGHTPPDRVLAAML